MNDYRQEGCSRNLFSLSFWSVLLCTVSKDFLQSDEFMLWVYDRFCEASETKNPVIIAQRRKLIVVCLQVSRLLAFTRSSQLNFNYFRENGYRKLQHNL